VLLSSLGIYSESQGRRSAVRAVAPAVRSTKLSLADAISAWGSGSYSNTPAYSPVHRARMPPPCLAVPRSRILCSVGHLKGCGTGFDRRTRLGQNLPWARDGDTLSNTRQGAKRLLYLMISSPVLTFPMDTPNSTRAAPWSGGRNGGHEPRGRRRAIFNTP
jgi:hypothetical protein